MASKSKLLVPNLAPLNAILHPLSDALRRSCGRKDLAINEVDQLSANALLYALTGVGAVRASTDRQCVLHQLFPKSHPELWLGISLQLRKHSGYGSPAKIDMYEILHVSIQVFEGTTSQTVEPLLRAEWDPVTSRSNTGPAQPHWHAYTRPIIAKQGGFLQEARHEFPTTPSHFFHSIKQRQHRFHFALCANWHEERGRSYQILSTPDQLRRWVIGVVEYIKSQL